jgi:molybdopterin-guanine dinucleotide biosynthesis protein A
MGAMSGPVGVVLAGGRSRRMGRDKALLELAGETLAARAARRLAAVCDEVGLADAGRGSVPGFPSLPDGAGQGPAAGILGAAAAYPGRALLVLACDLPDVPAGLLSLLAAAGASSAAPSGGAADWVVPRWSGGLEPLCSLFGPGALAALEERVLRGEMALHELAATSPLRIRYLDEALLLSCGEPARMFDNLNRPEDFELRRLRPEGELKG